MIKKLQADLKDAMRSGDALKRDIVRGLLAAIKNEAITQKKDIMKLDDEEIVVIIKRAKKQRDDAAAQYRDGDREDLAQKEESEAIIIKEYLPEEMTDDEISRIIDDVIAMAVSDNFGAVMGQVMAQSKGRADGVRVKKLVEAKMQR